MFCKTCGEEINENAVVCPKCGCLVGEFLKSEDTKEENKNGMAIAGFVCSFLSPILGWVFGGIGLARSKKKKGKGKGFSIAALAIASANFLLYLALI